MRVRVASPAFSQGFVRIEGRPNMTMDLGGRALVLVLHDGDTTATVSLGLEDVREAVLLAVHTVSMSVAWATGKRDKGES